MKTSAVLPAFYTAIKGYVALFPAVLARLWGQRTDTPSIAHGGSGPGGLAGRGAPALLGRKTEQAWCRSKWERLLPSFLPLPKSGVAMPALPAGAQRARWKSFRFWIFSLQLNSA